MRKLLEEYFHEMIKAVECGNLGRFLTFSNLCMNKINIMQKELARKKENKDAGSLYIAEAQLLLREIFTVVEKVILLQEKEEE